MPKWPEKSSKSRYSEAFKDIAEKHISNPEDITDGKKVVIAGRLMSRRRLLK